ncbi:MAG: 2'-5' RNA ligase family protein, partial [candidate division Zixibacteria bacterium]|nr:2'-5' RNA ligase family protein [candidate division Zixibacteria bacterium]
LHKQLWQTVAGACDDLSLLYAPEVWVPHISLAYEDVDRENLRQAMSELAFETYNWRFVVDHIAFIRESEGQVGELKWKIPLGR